MDMIPLAGVVDVQRGLSNMNIVFMLVGGGLGTKIHVPPTLLYAVVLDSGGEAFSSWPLPCEL